MVRRDIWCSRIGEHRWIPVLGLVASHMVRSQPIVPEEVVALARVDNLDVSEVSGGFEYFRLGFAHGRVPTELDSVPSRTRRALSNGTIGDPNIPTHPPKKSQILVCPHGTRNPP